MTAIVSVADFSTISNTFTLTNGSTPGRAVVVVGTAGNAYISTDTRAGNL